MEPVVVSCLQCSARVRVRRPEIDRELRCPRCNSEMPRPRVHPAEGRSGAVEPRTRIEKGQAVPWRLGGVWHRRARVLSLTVLTLLLSANAIWQTLGPDANALGRSLQASRVDFGTPLTGSTPRGLLDSPASEIREKGLVEITPEPSAVRDSPLISTVRAQLLTFPGPGNPPPPNSPKAEALDAPSTRGRGPVPQGPSLPPRPESPHPDEPSLPATSDDSPPSPDSPPEADRPEPKRIRVRIRDGRTVVARVHGGSGRETHILLPDGQLGVPDSLVYTEAPFRPATAEEMAKELSEGPFQGFEVQRSPHYVILYRSSAEFAAASAEVLENLYKGLTEAFRKRDFPVTEAEFPLVAVIFKTEREFRAHKEVDQHVQAYYEIDTNRIYFYETSVRDVEAPEVAAQRRPQTVAHEGTHQILQNIGIHPRMAAWPPWLVEGLAEYCATPATTKKGTTWMGLGVANARHLATIRDLEDPLSAQVPGNGRPEHIGRLPGMPLVEYLVTKPDLSPTDYALSWAMTHYLAVKRVDAFVRYLKTMSRMPPLEPRSPEEHLAAFQEAFGGNLRKMDREIGSYLSKLKSNDVLPFYAVLFQQRVPGGLVKRAAIVSQSPSMIQQWLETVTSPRGDPPVWEPVKHPSRTRAWITAQQWMSGY